MSNQSNMGSNSNNNSNMEVKQENPYAMRSMAYLEHVLYELQDDFYEWKADMRRMRKQGENPSEYELGIPDKIFNCQDVVKEEIGRREALGIVDPEGFCDFKDNEGADWDWDCPCENCQRQIEEMNAAADEWENQCGDEGPEIGNCGFPCDGHCQQCDPGYMDRMRYGAYDHAGEI